MSERVFVHVYYATPAAWTSESMARDWALLEPAERERADRFRFESDRSTYVAAHALLRRALSRHAPVDAAAWRFTGGARDRPEIAAPSIAPRLRFSLSHTRGLAACAIASEVDVGFDVEPVERAAPLEVAPRFAPAERAALASLPPGQREERFFVYWTLKEAYAKACGLGLAIALDEVSFEVDSTNVRASFGPGRPDDERVWRFATWTIEGAFRAAVAVRTASDIAIHQSIG
jgi:4'-phosphopantetheinyl transferase